VDSAIAELEKNPLAVSLISLIVGSILTILLANLRNKSGVLGYTTIWNQIGISADNRIHGEVRVHWQNQQVRNLFAYTIDVENLSSIDYDNIALRFYSGADTIILTEQSHIVDQPSIVPLSPDFRSRMVIPDGQAPSQQQIEEYNHNREYLVPVLNRRQKLSFTFLCTKPNDDNEPGIFVTTPSKGVRLKRLKLPFVVLNPIFGVPIPVALARAIGLAIVVVILCGFFMESIWMASLASMIFGLFGQVFGAILYRGERFVRDLLTR
jgi:hypothetical protein